MAYSETYTADDVDNIVIDGLSAVLVVGVSFATLIGLVIIFVMAKRTWKKNK